MSEVLIQCPNCGANIDENIDKCPFCGYINPKGAEQKYMEHLEDVRLQLDNVDEEAQIEYKKGLKGAFKVILIVAAIAAVVCAIVYGINRMVYNRLMSGFGYESPEKEMEELAYMRDLFAQCDVLYEAGNYEDLTELLMGQAAHHNIWDYDHYPFVSAYNKYRNVRDWYIPHIERSGYDEDYYRGALTQEALYYYYRTYVSDHIVTQELTSEEEAVLDQIREDYMLDIVYNRLGFSDSELEGYQEKIFEKGYFDIKEVDKITDSVWKRYK